MPLVRVEIHLQEIRESIALFKKDRKQALETLVTDIREAARYSFQELLNAEIDLFLGTPEQADNKRNGYLPERSYIVKGIGGLTLKLPRDRMRRFESAIVPKHERIDPRLQEDIAVLQLAGISTRTLSMLSKRLLGVELSKDALQASLGTLSEQASNWLTRPLEGRYWALYVDGTNFKVQRRNSTQPEPSLVVLGVDESNHRSILAIEPGSKDSADAWRSVFKELKRRGLDGDAVRLGIMDGLPGLETVFREEFSRSRTQRCWVHSKRNALAKCPKRLLEAFSELLDKVVYSASEDEARRHFSELKRTFSDDAARAVRCIEKDLESLLTFYSFEQGCWQALRTTNPIETINRQFKRRTKNMDTLGERTLETVLAFVSLKIEFGWRRHRIDSAIYQPKRKRSGSKDTEVGGVVEVNPVESAVAEMRLLN
jgi:putative transposase